MEFLKKSTLGKQGNWMVLARINDVKKELQEEAKRYGFILSRYERGTNLMI